MSGARARLRALTVPLDPVRSFDPVAVAGRSGVVFADTTATFAGLGRAASLQLPGGLADRAAVAGISELLADIEHEAPTGVDGAVPVRAFGALPFDRRGPGELVVPTITFTRRQQGGATGQWVTVVGSAPDEGDVERALSILQSCSAGPCPAGPGGVGSDDPTLTSVAPEPEPDLYADAVAKALTAIEAGGLSKVVLARSLRLTLAGPADGPAVLRRLRAAEPLCTLFALTLPDGRRFLGASPELLVARHGRTVSCHPLAGTVGLGAPGGDEEAVARFLASAKDRAEHQAVVDEILKVLGPRCESVTAPGTPSLVRLHSVAHLGTLIEGTLREDRAAPGALELVAQLHPTPAVGGVPRDAALRCIEELEPFDREAWAGPVGWVDAAGDGRFVIGIRSVALDHDRARLWAGAGIVAGSQPEAELAETTVKLAPVLEALAPGAPR